MIEHLQKVIALVNFELTNEYSGWHKEALVNIVLPEMQELYDHFIVGERFFKYGKKQRMLQSTYYMTDTLDNLWATELGEAITELQEVYNRI